MQEKNINDKTQDMTELVKSLELVSARLFEMTIKNTQISTHQTPEMIALFDKWIDCIGGEILRLAAEAPELDLKKAAETTGLTSPTIIGLALALHRQGKLEITHIRTQNGDGIDKDICNCFK